VQADFAKSYRDAPAFYNELYKKLSGYEVSMLINNAGISTTANPFVEHTDDELEVMLGVNINAQAILSHHFIPVFEKRFKETS
jgi:short-subunit dehydrogenase